MDDFLVKLAKSCGVDVEELFEPFVPCAVHHEELDWLIYLERDCSYTAHHVEGSNIELLYDNADGQLVGVQIAGWSHVKPKESTDGKVAVAAC
jgi:hypothetical protein